jgi:hypothetical protein
MYFGLNKHPEESRCINSPRLGIIQRYQKNSELNASRQKIKLPGAALKRDNYRHKSQR